LLLAFFFLLFTMAESTKATGGFSLLGVSDEFFVIKKSGLSQAQALTAYLGGSAFQTICDNPITAYRYEF
jgi:hypothetical protein